MPEKTENLAFLSLTESARLIQTGQLSPVELTEALLRRIERLEPQLNAFIGVWAEEAREQARVTAEELARSQDRSSLGPLHGVPVAIKDLYDVRGQPTQAGSTIPGDAPAARDAFVVARLRASGAVFLGKTMTHEWALGTTTVNPHFGPTHIPWDLSRIAGGSSGGNAAGLAAGLFAGCLGSDTGGSIRIPAALCGIVGLKPTRGRLSLAGIVPLAWALDHAGPMARSVADTALLLAVVEGYDPADPESASPSADGALGEIDGGVAGLRIGVPTDYFWDDLDPGVEAAVRTAIGVLGELGAELVDLPPLDWKDAFRANGTMLLADAAAVHADHLRDSPEKIGPDVLARLRRGQQITGPAYAAARRAQADWRRKLARQFEQVDLFATPATSEPARTIAEAEGISTARVLTSLTAPFNLTGLPAISVPLWVHARRIAGGAAADRAVVA